MQTFRLDFIGNIQAPVGTRDWTRAAQIDLHRELHDMPTTVKRVQHRLQLIRDQKAYQHLDNQFGHPFASFKEFATTRFPVGLGADWQLVEDVLREKQPERTIGELVAAKTKQGERTDLANLAKLSQEARAEENDVSLATQKKLDYLYQHAPDAFAQVQAGELSISKAYNLVRGVHGSVSMPVPIDPVKLAEALRSRFGDDFCAALKDAL